MKTKLLKSTLWLFAVILVTSCSPKEEKILVFSKTAGFRHGSIESGVQAVKKLGNENNIKVVATEDASYFVEDSLKQYSAIVFLNTTGDILDPIQQADFERYIQAGGGYVGVHAATDTEYEWPWYNKLAGAYFASHPHIQEATLKVLDNTHPATQFLDSTWQKKDEWYNFKSINSDVNVLIEIDENSYKGGKNGDHHPMSWYHNYDGGRAFYTGMGHTKETYENPTFIKHLLGGIKYAIGDNTRNYSLAKTDRVPPENRFVKEVLDFNLDEPMELDELPGKGIIYIERKGALKLYDFESESVTKIGQMNPYIGEEDGLLGIAVDPNYNENHWIYLFHSKLEGTPRQHVSRFTLVNDTLDHASEKVLMEIPIVRGCCHSGGSLEFDTKGNLYIAIGDNTNPFESNGYAPIDEREGRALWDAQKSSANTNSFTGKILRITPQDDGTYTIPEGNLFPEGTPNTKPEIYVMGTRNPFRPSIDSKTGYLYWGDVGPDAGKTNASRGPKGMGEFNQARKAGFWGWPYTRGNNQVYNDFDFTTNKPGAKFDPNHLINDSPNNTGLKELPPAQESLIWFSYDKSEEFPWLGTGGVNPMAGPIFHESDFPNASEGKFPKYFEDKLIVYEWMRDWIYVVTLDENQNYVKAEPFMPNSEFSHPMDMIFASDGNLYVLEYGQKWFAQNLDARLDKISYVAGNRKPIAKITTDKSGGGTPLTIQFSGSESIDFDNDKLSYEWSFTNDEVQATDSDPSFTFNTPGAYTVNLKVTDKEGETSTATTKVLVGNDAPKISITVDPNTEFFGDHKKVNYIVSVTDKQDGSTKDKTIDPDAVKVTLSYIPEGKDMVKAAFGHQENTIPEGLKIINGTDCKACHATNIKVNGPSYMEISNKYTSKDASYLASKIINGGSGVWGETVMSAHPQLKSEEIEKIVDYILSLKSEVKPSEELLPTKGTIEFTEHINSKKEGIYVLMASYEDKGSPDLQGSSLSAQTQIIFKAPKIEAEKADKKSAGLRNWDVNDSRLVGSIVHNSYLKFDKVNLEGLNSIKLSTFYGNNYHYKGTVEIREGDANGKLIGKKKISHFHKKDQQVKNYKIPVSPTTKKGDLCIVFKNEENKEQFIANADYILLNYSF